MTQLRATAPHPGQYIGIAPSLDQEHLTQVMDRLQGRWNDSRRSSAEFDVNFTTRNDVMPRNSRRGRDSRVTARQARLLRDIVRRLAADEETHILMVEVFRPFSPGAVEHGHWKERVLVRVHYDLALQRLGARSPATCRRLV